MKHIMSFRHICREKVASHYKWCHYVLLRNIYLCFVFMQNGKRKHAKTQDSVCEEGEKVQCKMGL